MIEKDINVAYAHECSNMHRHTYTLAHMSTGICMHMYKYHRYIIHPQVHMKAWSYTAHKHMCKHICISRQVCTQLNMYIHCTYIHVHRCLHPQEHTCTHTHTYTFCFFPFSQWAIHLLSTKMNSDPYVRVHRTTGAPEVNLILFYQYLCSTPWESLSQSFFKVKISSFGELNLAWRGREKRLECRRHRRTELKL